MTTSTSEDDLVSVALNGHTGIVTMNRSGRRNVSSNDMKVALVAAFERLVYHETDCRVIVLSATGKDFWPNDLPEPANALSLAELRKQVTVANRLFKLIWMGNKPVIAAVEGKAAGVGLSLVSACDVSVASADASLECSFINEGRIPEAGLLWSLSQKAGAGKARQLMLNGSRLSAQQAKEMGLLSQIAGAGHALRVACNIAEQFSELPPVTLALLKGALVHGTNSISAASRHEMDLNPLVRQTQDHKEAVSAFMEKRSPQFIGA